MVGSFQQVVLSFVSCVSFYRCQIAGLEWWHAVNRDILMCGLQMKAMSVEDLNERQSPLESGPSEAVEEVEGKETMVRPASMINVAAILEKANAIRQVLLQHLRFGMCHANPFLSLFLMTP